MRFPSSYNAGDAVGACGELAIRRTDVVITYEVSNPQTGMTANVVLIYRTLLRIQFHRH